jgi:hypothetical protein
MTARPLSPREAGERATGAFGGTEDFIIVAGSKAAGQLHNQHARRPMAWRVVFCEKMKNQVRWRAKSWFHQISSKDLAWCGTVKNGYRNSLRKRRTASAKTHPKTVLLLSQRPRL